MMRASMMLLGLLKFGPDSLVTSSTVLSFRMLKMLARIDTFCPCVRLTFFSKRMSS